MDSLIKNRSVLVGLLVLIGAAVGAVLSNLERPVAVLLASGGGLIGIALAASSIGDFFSRATSAARRAAEGERVPVPTELPGAAAALYEELDRLGGKLGRARAAEESVPRILEALRRVAQGERASLGDAVIDRAAFAAAFDELAGHSRVRADPALERKLEEAEQRAAEAERRASEAEARSSEAPKAPAGLDDIVRRDIQSAADELETVVQGLGSGVSEQLAAVEQATRTLREMASGLSELARSVEKLATSAEESSSSILEVSATNQEVAENIANLARSVSQTVASIEQMTASIREVARNVDGLSLTAEETSSSMNEMDVSIDQVQSNANETARLSEEVSQDAERGAEAILKTIGEINRIKETSQEGVSVISNLGSRIEAIGQIVNVIDDVAEQTNLLALNAAIIAAQAGEHGKGFAVVADEIKDLAERAGASTKEITDLIKTIQAESKNAIGAVEKGASMVDRGVEVSNEAERALKKILESSRKSTNMVRAIARATVEQAKGSKQVTDAMGRIAETVQQIAAATAQQARGSEQIMKSAEQMRMITEHVERSAQEQARGGRQISQSMEAIASSVNQLNDSHRTQARSSEVVIGAAQRIEEIVKSGDAQIRRVNTSVDRLRRIARGN